MRGDLRTFPRRRKGKPGEHGFLARSDFVLTCMVISHVGDLLYVGNHLDYQILPNVMNKFRIGEADAIGVSTPFVFCGVQISMSKTGRVELDQLEFPDALKPMEKENVIKHGTFCISR